MKAVPTMQDGARVADYSRAAVSLALRGDRTIAEAARRPTVEKRIQRSPHSLL